MRPIHFVLIALLLFGITTASSARDLPHTDPERKAILDAMRSSPDRTPNSHYVVKDLYRSGDFAWLCAVESDKYGVVRNTDESITVHAFVLLLDKGTWILDSPWYGWLGHEGADDCSAAGEKTLDRPGPPASKDDFKAVWQFVVKKRLLGDLEHGHFGKTLADEMQSKVAVLKAHGVLEDFVIDHSMEKFSQVYFDNAAWWCKDANCRNAITQAAADLSRLHGDSRVSSLVWDNCQHDGPVLMASCIDTHMPKPYCRPGLLYFQDKDDIQHCLDDIAKQL